MQPPYNWNTLFIILLYCCVILGGCLAAVAADKRDFEEDNLIAAVLILEAGGEGIVGMEAVFEVICNRSKSRQVTKAQVVTQKLQFSCLNNITKEDAIKKARDHSRWPEALAIIQKPPTNHTKGANHYHATSIQPPYWAKNSKITVIIKNHVFYKL